MQSDIVVAVRAGLVRFGPDNEAAVLGPGALRTLNAYKTKSGVAKAFFVSTGRFSEATIQQAGTMGITLADGTPVNQWRQKAAAKAQTR